jgi:hypothetical protein
MDDFQLQLIYRESVKRFEDGEFLSSVRNSDSGYLLKILGFELMLKASLYLEKNMENTTHNYDAMYCTLSRELKRTVCSKAQEISQIFDISDRIHEILKWYTFNFVNLRYPYQQYKGLAADEYLEYSELYSELGCPEGEAEFEYFPEELRGLYMALEGYVSGTINKL